MDCSRRSALRLVGSVAGLTATAGCLALGSSGSYTLHAGDVDSRSLGAEYLLSDPSSVEAETHVDFDTATKQQYVADLFADGEVTVRQWPLVRQDPWGRETRPRPTFVRRDGTYYEVRVDEERRVDRERWLLAVERTDDAPPDDARVGTAPFDSLSEDDRRVLLAALDAVYAGNDGFLGEPEFDELRTVQYHQDLSVADSDLVPSPTFEYVEYEREDFRVVTDQRVVSIPERTFSVEPVAESREAFDSYAAETLPDARLDDAGLSADAREVLDTAVEGRRPYEEDHPLSDGLSEVVDALGIVDDLRPMNEYEDQAVFQEAVASYGGEWYRFNLHAMP